jgi:hypothetical protein
MNFGGHVMAGWLIANSVKTRSVGERRLITLIGILPDIDGIFTFVPGLGHLHRTFGHNVWLLLISPIAATFLFLPRERRAPLFPLLLLSIGIHFIFDLFVTGWWPLMPLWPFSMEAFYMDRYIPEHIMKYYIQIGLFAVLLIPTLHIVIKKKRSPLEVISPGFDCFVQNFVTLPWHTRCTSCGKRAFYRCSSCGRPLCGIHRKFGKRLAPVCKPGCPSGT